MASEINYYLPTGGTVNIAPAVYASDRGVLAENPDHYLVNITGIRKMMERMNIVGSIQEGLAAEGVAMTPNSFTTVDTVAAHITLASPAPTPAEMRSHIDTVMARMGATREEVEISSGHADSLVVPQEQMRDRMAALLRERYPDTDPATHWEVANELEQMVRGKEMVKR